MASPRDSWTVAELQEELKEFEQELCKARLRDNSIKTYVDRADRFIRWLAGEFQPRGTVSR